MSVKQKQNGVSGQISWKLMCGVKGTLHAALNAPALSEAGPRWGGVCVCVWGGGVNVHQTGTWRIGVKGTDCMLL